MKKRYVLELDEDQAQALSEACEFMSRIGMAQLTEVVTSWSFNWKVDRERKDQAERAMLFAKSQLTDLGASHAYYSISSPDVPNVCKVAYDLHQVIRYRLAWDHNPNPEWNTHKNEPMRYGKSPLATIKPVDEL